MVYNVINKYGILYKMIKLYISYNWDTTANITEFWSKCMKPGVPLQLVVNREEADYYLVINKPNSDDEYDYFNKKTILVRMEPFMEKHPEWWGEWANPDFNQFLYVIAPPAALNFIEWHLQKSYDDLTLDYSGYKTKGNCMSVILSDKYNDEGQIQRIDFIRYLQKHYSDKIQIDVYGKGDLSKWGIQNHLGELPLHNKEGGLLEYKYHFNCENSFNRNYVTEKFYDPIFMNTLVFYEGAKNIRTLYPDGGFIHLHLDDFKLAADAIVHYIESDEYSKQQEAIQKLKLFILETFTFAPRLYKLLNAHTGAPPQSAVN